MVRISNTFDLSHVKHILKPNRTPSYGQIFPASLKDMDPPSFWHFAIILTVAPMGVSEMRGPIADPKNW